jgi:hypothetical protein
VGLEPLVTRLVADYALESVCPAGTWKWMPSELSGHCSGESPRIFCAGLRENLGGPQLVRQPLQSIRVR